MKTLAIGVGRDYKAQIDKCRYTRKYNANIYYPDKTVEQRERELINHNIDLEDFTSLLTTDFASGIDADVVGDFLMEETIKNISRAHPQKFEKIIVENFPMRLFTRSPCFIGGALFALHLHMLLSEDGRVNVYGHCPTSCGKDQKNEITLMVF